MRLSSASCGSQGSQSYSYDPFGNLSNSANLLGTSFEPLYSNATNRITNSGVVYDSGESNGPGNITTDNLGYTYTWDSFGDMLTVDTGSYTATQTYDAFGRMVETSFGSSTSQYLYGPVGQNLLALMNGLTLVKAFVPLVGGTQVVYEPSGIAFYRHADWLGSARLSSTPSRTLDSSAGYTPFGQLYDKTGSDYSFTGDTSFLASGIYDFPLRRLSTSQGRWISPDPAGVKAVDPKNPQSWNRYAYVLNNPLALTDPSGLCPPPGRDGKPRPCNGNGGDFGDDGDDVDNWGNCTVDLIGMPCSMAYGFLESGAAAVYPNNACEIAGPNGLEYFWASTNGPGAYYAYSGPGALYYDLGDAQAGGALAAFNAMVAGGVPQEWGDAAYEDANGVFSFTAPEIIGPPCSEDETCEGGISLTTPDGTQLMGTEHTHPWPGGSNQFDGDMEQLLTSNSTYLDYVGAPSSDPGYAWGLSPRVFVINPNSMSVCLLLGPQTLWGSQACN